MSTVYTANSPPIKGSAFTFYISLVSQSDTDVFQTNPTLATGDFKISIDGGALNNLATLPVVTPTGSKMVKVELSAAETNGDKIMILPSDQAGDEWQDALIILFTVSAVTVPSAAEVNAEVVDVLRTDLIPDSYAADGAQPTIAQAILAVLQFLTEKSVSGTTVTVKKPDGTTQAMTFSLNNDSAPTSISRAT